MRLKLKKFKINKAKILTKKNLFFSLITLFVVGFVIGIIFFFKISVNDKIKVTDNIYDYFNYINSSGYNFINYFKISAYNNLLLTISIWILGISVIGLILILFILFLKGFSLGFTISAIISKYGIKGVVGSILYIFPDKIIISVLTLSLAYFAIVFSYRLINNLIENKKFDLASNMKSYFKFLIIALIISVISSILEVFVSPLFLKLFTFLIN